MLLRAALRALIWTVAALILAGLALSALTSPGVAAAAAPLVCDGGAALVPAPAAEAADDGVEPPAYLCRGAGPDRPVTMTELIVAAAKAVGSALLVVLWPLLTWVFYRRAARGRKFVLADGVPATARVVAARPTVFADRSQRVMEIELDFAPDGAPARGPSTGGRPGPGGPGARSPSCTWRRPCRPRRRTSGRADGPVRAWSCAGTICGRPPARDARAISCCSSWTPPGRWRRGSG